MKKLLKTLLAAAVILSTLSSSAVYAAADNLDIEVGDSVYFGSYEIDGDVYDGKETLEWTVLDITEERMLLLCDYCIDALPYDSYGDDITWAESEIREWLNNDFVDTAFNGDPYGFLWYIYNSTSDGYTKADGGDNTNDGVFLLSINEVKKYLPDMKSRRATVTEYAKQQGASCGENNYGRWWLRSPGFSQDTAAYIEGGMLSGLIMRVGEAVECNSICVRPAIWINIDAVEEALHNSPDGTLFSTGLQSGSPSNIEGEFTMDMQSFMAQYGDPRSENDGFRYLASTEDGAIAIYGNNSNEGINFENGNYIYLVQSDMVQRFKCRWLQHYAQSVYWADFDYDGVNELLFDSKVSVGTGCCTYVEELAVFEPQADGSYTCAVLTLEEKQRLMREYITTEVNGGQVILTETEYGSVLGSVSTSYTRFDLGYDINAYDVDTYKGICTTSSSCILRRDDNGNYLYTDGYLAYLTDPEVGSHATATERYIKGNYNITAVVVYSNGKFDLTQFSTGAIVEPE